MKQILFFIVEVFLGTLLLLSAAILQNAWLTLFSVVLITIWLFYKN